MEMSGKQGDIREVAGGVVETLLRLMGINASARAVEGFSAAADDENNSALTLDIEGDDLGILIGRRGQTLASFQYIVRLIVSNQMQMRLPIVIDIEGYKRHRCESLRALALRIAERVSSDGAPFILEPMPAFERRVIHLALAEHPAVTTESTGLGEARKVVILPKE